MRELSLNILDIAQNSISAGTPLIIIEVSENTDQHTLLIGVYDNGKGIKNTREEKLFKQYLGHSRFIHNNIIGEIEYNRRIANIFNYQAPYVNNKYMESIFNYLREWNPFINDLDINTMQACNKPVLQALRKLF